MTIKLVKRTERGWAGHFCSAQDCHFRRNTLLKCGEQAVVISTVGAMYHKGSDSPQEIGNNRWYETMAFMVDEGCRYEDADVGRQVYFDSPWSIEGKSFPQAWDIDLQANDMHERVVAEITAKLLLGKDLEADERVET
jgi:hypothetical protein